MTKIRCIPERNQQSFYVKPTPSATSYQKQNPSLISGRCLTFYPRKMEKIDCFGYSRDFPPNMFILTRLSGSREIEILIVNYRGSCKKHLQREWVVHNKLSRSDFQLEGDLAVLPQMQLRKKRRKIWTNPQLLDLLMDNKKEPPNMTKLLSKIEIFEQQNAEHLFQLRRSTCSSSEYICLNQIYLILPCSRFIVNNLRISQPKVSGWFAENH